MNFRELFNKTINAEQQILRPYFFADAISDVSLATEETYLRLRLTRMFLRNRREMFKTKYPIVHAQMRFAGLDGMVETQFVARPELAGNDAVNSLDKVVTLDQTLLGPVLYRGGDLDLLLGLYAAPAVDWAERFIGLAEGISQFAVNAPLATAISVVKTVKNTIETTLTGDGVSLKLGLDKELREGQWLDQGYLVMIAAPDDQIDITKLVVEDGELLTQQGKIYRAHDYIVLSIEVTESRSDWQSLGYGQMWQTLMKTASEADDVAQVKKAYRTFAGAVMSSADLSWKDRNGIVKLAQKRVKQIRDARADDDFLSGLKGIGAQHELFAVAPDALLDVRDEADSADPQSTDFLD